MSDTILTMSNATVCDNEQQTGPTDPLQERDRRLQDQLDRLFKQYDKIVRGCDLNRDQKIGYLLAVCMVDTRFNTGWMPNKYGLQQINIALTRHSIT